MILTSSSSTCWIIGAMLFLLHSVRNSSRDVRWVRYFAYLERYTKLFMRSSKEVSLITTSLALRPSLYMTWPPSLPPSPCMTMYLPGVAVLCTLPSMNLNPSLAAICTS